MEDLSFRERTATSTTQNFDVSKVHLLHLRWSDWVLKNPDAFEK